MLNHGAWVSDIAAPTHVHNQQRVYQPMHGVIVIVLSHCTNPVEPAQAHWLYGRMVSFLHCMCGTAAFFIQLGAYAIHTHSISFAGLSMQQATLSWLAGPAALLKPLLRIVEPPAMCPYMHYICVIPLGYVANHLLTLVMVTASGSALVIRECCNQRETPIKQ